MTAKHLRITGIVQGVGYRMNFRARAQAFGLSGWVRNRADGSVEALVAGDDKALAAIVEWARHGPPAAEVDGVAVEDADPASVTPGGVEQLPTL